MNGGRFVDGHLGYLLGQANHALYKNFDSQLREAGVTSIEWRVLATLNDSPPLTVSLFSVRMPALLTARMRKLGADDARVMVAPLPSMVMSLVMTGRPLKALSRATRMYVHPLARLRVSAPTVPLAVSIAPISEGTEQGT